MTPTNSIRPIQRRVGNGSGRPNRCTSSSAGVNRHHAAAARNAPRARGVRPARNRNRAPAEATASTAPSLASRMTFTRGQGVAAAPVQGTIARSRARARSRHCPQTARALQDRITRADAAPIQTPAVTEDAAVRGDAMVDDLDFFTSRPSDTQTSALFCGSQPTQEAFTSPFAATQSTTSPFTASPPAPTTPSPRRPIRMHNTPPGVYRGTDPVKRAVSNSKLRAVLAGKSLPRERKKYVSERMELRLGTGGGTLK